MGHCCTCLRRAVADIEEMSMVGDANGDDQLLDTPPQVHSIDTDMSAPSIAITNDLKNSINGSGLALADVPVEQDKAYWEWRVNFSSKQGENPPLMFGVSNKRNAKFYEVGAAVPPEKLGTKFMSLLPNLKDGDVVGVAVQQSEIPMIQLYLNGEALGIGEGQVPRFRGTVFPAIFLPASESTTISATFLYREDQYIKGPPSPIYEPLIAERSLM